MEIAFETIHAIVIEALQPNFKKNKVLQVVGFWYYKFIKSLETELNLNIPHFNSKSITDIYDYLRLLSLAYKIINKSSVNSFQGMVLFNIFDHETNISTTPFEIEFIRQKGDYLIWSNNTVTYKKDFLPVFKSGAFIKADQKAIYNSFRLFKAIRKSGIINYPILIDLEKDISLSLSCGKLSREEYILNETIEYETTTSTDQDIELEDQLLKKPISDNIAIKYPYHRNIRGWFLNIGGKRFTLNIYNRLFYNEIEETGLYVLPREIFTPDIIIKFLAPKVSIIDTHHSDVLYQLFKDFKEEWQSHEFNKFSTPFPKLWLLLINDSQPKEEWINQFKSLYPNVSERSIINKIEKIIIELHKLNWGQLIISNSDSPVIVFPDLESAKGKKLEKAINSFKAFLSNLNTKILFVNENESHKYYNHKNIIFLDAFNLVSMANVSQNNKLENYNIIVPDFLYYNYQPWLKYHLLKYQTEPLLSYKRQILDSNFETHKILINDLKRNTIDDIKHGLKEYFKKYNSSFLEVEKEKEMIKIDDSELKNDEEVEIQKKRTPFVASGSVQIITSTGLILTLPSTEQILLQRNTIILGEINSLLIGDQFVLPRDLRSTVVIDGLINKLSRIPLSVQNFQNALFKIDNVYENLTRRGLEYAEYYFKERYLIDPIDNVKKQFIMPRKRKNWELICEYLNIPANDMFLAWVAYYGQKEQFRIKEMYRHILKLLLENHNLGEASNPILIEIIGSYIEERKELFGEDVFDARQIAISLIGSIQNSLEFHEVKEIKFI